YLLSVHPTSFPSRRSSDLMSSLVLNVFLVGAAVGGVFMWSRAYGDGPLPPIRRPEGLLQASQALSPEFRPVVRDAVQEAVGGLRSEEHTSELQSRENLVCR